MNTIRTCPRCKRTYDDDSYNYCLEDGTLLSVTRDPNATLINLPLNVRNQQRTEVLPKKDSTPKEYGLEWYRGLSEQEKRDHSSAEHYAKVVVSFMGYDRSKYREGFANNNLYEALKAEITEARAKYNELIPLSITADRDYFYEEIVRKLCHGDPNRLGTDYPF